MADKRKYLTPKEKAKELGVHTNTLLRWRMDGTGPAFKKLGPKTVRYLPEEDAS